MGLAAAVKQSMVGVASLLRRPTVSVICPEISEMRIAAHRAGLAGKSYREIALEMQRCIALEKVRLGQTIPNHWYGFELSAQWWTWFAVDSANPEQALQYARNQRSLADDMKARPDYYAQRDAARYTHWQWFQRSAANDKETTTIHESQ